MFLQKIKLRNFKSHALAQFSSPEKIICLVGANGSGKTNLLDAIYFMCQTKSFLHVTDQQLIRQNESFFRIEALLKEGGETSELCAKCSLGSRKELELNGETVKKNSSYIGKFPVVLISPEDQVLISGGSEERRKFIDYTLSQTNAEYLETLIRYTRFLQQRNALLKSLRPGEMPDAATLDYYNLMLSEAGTLIYRYRVQLMAELQPLFDALYRKISLDREQVMLEYESQLKTNDLATLLKQDISREVYLQRTDSGIHKDDLEFSIQGQKLKRFASQGQQKTLLFSLKLAQFAWIRKKNNRLPLLLIDDIFDKLDNQRMERLMEVIDSDFTGQVFITDTGGGRLEKLMEGKNNARILPVAQIKYEEEK